MNIFVYADMESKIKHCRIKRNDEELTDKKLEKKINEIDKNRKNYHQLISNIEWGRKENYHLCINTSGLEIKEIIKPISLYIENWFRRKEEK